MTEFQVVKLGQAVPLSTERLAEIQVERDAIDRWTTATPEQRAGWARDARAERAAIRAAAIPVPLTADALLGKLGWSREYAEHVVQSYCDCWDGYDGWTTCPHADDLGVSP